MPQVPHSFLKTYTLEQLLDLRKNPNAFISAQLYGNASQHRALTTTYIQQDTITGTRKSAPFTKVSGPSFALDRGDSSTGKLVETPFINIYHTLTAASPLLMTRYPGKKMTPPLVSSGDMAGINSMSDNIKQAIADDMEDLSDRVANTKEWMACQLMQGGNITYSNEELGVNFSINIGRDAGRTLNLAPYLDAVDPTTIYFRTQLENIKSLQSLDGAPQITDAYCGSLVSSQIMKLMESGVIKSQQRDAGVNAEGNFSWGDQWRNYGERPLVMLNDIRFWTVANQVPNPATNVLEDKIRPKFIEFVSRTPPADDNRKVYYGARIDDIQAMALGQTDKVVGKQFVRAAFKEGGLDGPSYWYAQLVTRPLTWEKNPNISFSVQALA